MTLLGKYEEVVGLRRGGVERGRGKEESGGGRKMKGEICRKKRGREQKYKAMKELREKARGDDIIGGENSNRQCYESWSVYERGWTESLV